MKLQQSPAPFIILLIVLTVGIPMLDRSLSYYADQEVVEVQVIQAAQSIVELDPNSIDLEK